MTFWIPGEVTQEWLWVDLQRQVEVIWSLTDYTVIIIEWLVKAAAVLFKSDWTEQSYKPVEKQGAEGPLGCGGKYGGGGSLIWKVGEWLETMKWWLDQWTAGNTVVGENKIKAVVCN